MIPTSLKSAVSPLWVCKDLIMAWNETIHKRNVENVIQDKHSHGSSSLSLYSIKGNTELLVTVCKPAKGKRMTFFREDGGSCTTGKAWAVPTQPAQLLQLCGAVVRGRGHILAAPTPQAGPVQKMGSPVPHNLYLLWAQKFLASFGEGTQLWKKGLASEEIKEIYEVTPSAGRCSWLRAGWNILFFGISKTILPIWSHLPHNADCRLSLWESRIRLLTFS